MYTNIQGSINNFNKFNFIMLSETRLMDNVDESEIVIPEYFQGAWLSNSTRTGRIYIYYNKN